MSFCPFHPFHPFHSYNSYQVYNESDPNTDLRERREELERMSSHMVGSMDKDDDQMISLDEWMKHKDEKEYKEDHEWKPLTEGV